MRGEIHLMLLIHDKYDQERSKRNWRDRENAATGGNMRVSGGGVTAPGRHTGQWSPVELVTTLVSGPRRSWSPHWSVVPAGAGIIVITSS